MYCWWGQRERSDRVIDRDIYLSWRLSKAYTKLSFGSLDIWPKLWGRLLRKPKISSMLYSEQWDVVSKIEVVCLRTVKAWRTLGENVKPLRQSVAPEPLVTRGARAPPLWVWLGTERQRRGITWVRLLVETFMVLIQQTASCILWDKKTSDNGQKAL